MLEITNKAKFDETVSQAIENVAFTVENESTARRWINAINKAAEMIEAQAEFMTFDSVEDNLLIWNQESNEIYTANGICQCKAFRQGFPCKHRAAYKLVKNYIQ